MFKRWLQRTRNTYAYGYAVEILGVLVIVAACAQLVYQARAKAADPQDEVATRPAHGLDVLTVKTISEGDDPLQLIIAISDTGAVDIEFVPKPMKVIVAQ